MRTAKNYSPAFKESALQKVYNRGNKTITGLADELNINVYTLKSWMRDNQSIKPDSRQPQSSQSWSAEQRLLALHESHGLSGEALNTWCREHGLFSHQLTQWREDFCQVAPVASLSNAEKQQLKQLKLDNQQLERELRRKEKALAEAAALLVLQKKYHALFEDEVVSPPSSSGKR
jgi:transposase-like protein